MRRSHPLTLFAAAAAGLALAAPAQAAVVAPAGTDARSLTVTAGPAGRAVLTWIAGGKRVELSEYTPGSGFGPVQRVLEAPVLGGGVFGALAPDRLVVLASRGSSNLPSEGVAAERPAGATSFGPPKTIATSDQYTEIVAFGSNARGDIAAAIRTQYQRVLLVTAPHGGAFGAPQEIGRPGDKFYSAAAAVGPNGELVVAYHDGRSRAFAQQGTVGGPLGAPQELSRAGNFPEFHAAIDGSGNATVAYERNVGRTRLVVVAARASAGHGFAPARTLARSNNVRISSLAAAGNTTAVSWDDLTTASGVRVAIAHGTGPFGHAQNPAAPPFRLRGEAGRYPSQANSIRLAVDARGDVLAAYPYGPFASVHASLLRAGSRSFRAPRVLSSLGSGGYPQVALTSGRTPILAWIARDGSVRATTSLNGTSVKRHPPRPTLGKIDTHELGTNGIVTAKLRCSATCAFSTIARMTTGRARGQVITRRYVGERVLGAGRTLELRFELKAGSAEAFQRTGRAQVKVIITAANASGASYTVRRVAELGRRLRS